MNEGIKTEKRKQAEQAIEERNKAIAKNRSLITNDGYIIKKEGEWGWYDSSINDFAETFLDSLPEEYKKNKNKLSGKIFKNYIEETLLKSKEESKHLTGIEFGGPGSNFFSGFTVNFFSNSVGVCLKDNRDEYLKKQDARSNHSVITEDILDPQKNNSLIKKILYSLGANKTDLIISRMQGPLGELKMNPDILDRIFRNWYNILNENGLMFIQFEYSMATHKSPSSNEILIRKWAAAIENIYPQIDIQLENNFTRDGIFRLHKGVGAPEKLPPATQLFKQH